MKKLIIFLTLSLFLASCVKDSREYKELKAEHDSLMLIKTNKDREVNDYFKTLNEIADNFDKVRATEQYVNSEASGEKISSDAATRIKDNIQLMTQILDKNKQEIAKLGDQVKKSKSGYSALQKTIDRLNATLQERSLAIDSLKMELAGKDEKLNDLGKQVGALNENVDVLSKDNKKKAELIKRQEDLLNTAWYVFGSRRELKAQKILTKNGIFSSTKVLQKDFNKDYFVKIDIRTTTSIPLYSKKAKVLTNHPMASYAITTENGAKVIQIKNATDFWSVSKYLVIEID